MMLSAQVGAGELFGLYPAQPHGSADSDRFDHRRLWRLLSDCLDLIINFVGSGQIASRSGNAVSVARGSFSANIDGRHPLRFRLVPDDARPPLNADAQSRLRPTEHPANADLG